MRLIKFTRGDRQVSEVGLIRESTVVPLASGNGVLSALLDETNLDRKLEQWLATSKEEIPLAEVTILAPLDDQEVWGAGVTYERSKVAREQESESAAVFYDRVYQADRPELFLKATPHRVSGPGEPVRVRSDSCWTVPEPELALVLNRRMELVGFTIGNDMSARDIEGRNPLYLPQAKLYTRCCGLGPAILLADGLRDRGSVGIRMEIHRSGTVVYSGSTSLSRMARSFEELIAWLARENTFPAGVILLTGTGLVPPDDFALRAGDLVSIEVDGVGKLENPVEG